MLDKLRIYWRHGADVMRRQGPNALGRLIVRRLNRTLGRYQPGFYDFGYQRWRIQQKRVGPNSQDPVGNPTFSIIVPVYNTPAHWLRETIRSVIAQSYPHWQCLLINDGSSDPAVGPILDGFAAEDSRLSVHHLGQNRGIAGASQTGLERSNGDFIALLDHDDLLDTNALLEAAQLLDRQPDCDLIYSDEDKVDRSGRYSAPYFKPDWSPTLLRGQNYISHLLILKRSLAVSVGGFRAGFDGAQDYDLVLRASARATKVQHIPKVLYHWRQLPGSTAMGTEEKAFAAPAGLRALQDSLDRTHPDATAFQGEMVGTYRVNYPIAGTPLVSVIIPFRDRPGLLQRCLDALFEHTSWPALEVVCVDNDSTDPEISVLKKHWMASDANVRFIESPGAFNFSAICNNGVAASAGEFVVLMNNDVFLASDRWLETLLGHAQQPDNGAVGGRLHFPDGRIQHAGIVVGIGGSAGHPFKTFPPHLPGYFGRLQIASNVSAITGALLMVRRSYYDAAGGLDAEQLPVAFSDVDFCLKLQQAGYRNVLEPACHGVHAESVSRGSDDDSSSRQRFDKERAIFQHRWASLLAEGDPCYNPNLTLDAEDYSLNWRLV